MQQLCKSDVLDGINSLANDYLKIKLYKNPKTLSAEDDEIISKYEKFVRIAFDRVKGGEW